MGARTMDRRRPHRFDNQNRQTYWFSQLNLREQLSMKKMTKISVGVALAVAASVSGAAYANGGYTFPAFTGAADTAVTAS
ncbi:MAG: hypothetical protein WDM77_01670 [Steroidobacteraceae bacterium]